MDKQKNKFWSQLKPGFLVLAPMDDVTNSPFRLLIAECAAPDVYFTEFINVDGLQKSQGGALDHKLLVSPSEDKPVLQLWGLDPVNYRNVGSNLNLKDYAAIDINMGCPVPKVIKKGACSALINNRELTASIIDNLRAGIGDLELSVKCRVGWNEVDLSWIEFLLSQNLDALSVHFRTTKELSKVPAHWELATKIVELRDKISPKTKIIGNGDIRDATEAAKMIDDHRVDGVMLGRAVFSNPYAFSYEDEWSAKTPLQKIDLLLRHIELFTEAYPDHTGVGLKRMAKCYLNSFDGASAVRTDLMQFSNARDMAAKLQSWRQKLLV